MLGVDGYSFWYGRDVGGGGEVFHPRVGYCTDFSLTDGRSDLPDLETGIMWSELSSDS